MAFRGADAGLIYRAAQAHLSEADGSLNEWQLARRLQDGYGAQFPDQPLQAYQGIARQAINARAMGEAMTDNPSAVPIAGLGIDPSIQDYEAEFRYRVLITLSDDTGATFSQVLEINSNQALSYEDLADRAAGLVGTIGSEGRGDRRLILEVGMGASVRVEILSAGRRR